MKLSRRGEVASPTTHASSGGATFLHQAESLRLIPLCFPDLAPVPAPEAPQPLSSSKVNGTLHLGWYEKTYPSYWL